jgi:hypothetical protein
MKASLATHSLMKIGDTHLRIIRLTLLSDTLWSLTHIRMVIHLTFTCICLLLSCSSLYFGQLSGNKRKVQRLNLRDHCLAAIQITHIFLVDLLEVLTWRCAQCVLGLVDRLVFAQGRICMGHEAVRKGLVREVLRLLLA